MTANGCIVHCGGDGPLLVRSPLRVRTAGAEDGIAKPKAALCRCGQSANKPFCDGAHRDIEFRAGGPIDTTRATSEPEAPSGPSGEEAGEAVVTAHANGPLHFDGVVEISGEGHDGSARFLQPWLCRCGASKNKPFCDGSHKEIGFEAEGL
ncbi:CDGSH iron-sulfur domain-containing protein [Candidatus Palauibacter soopunensis]|uniref:CDGSH iron-sulfur domain-containing protein n=1 Tax=Candidatus Palauibacter soopunensis TaxID=3056739 RepID=UPI00238BCB0B|nr:CDGSH iron-sulfur domain-containing protein [Candidatus Palauibacter soopunensis]MDE2879262.1 CDGSH iron-sulfur domain-containing protein [Candidatus Palauibacter soopunensis]